MSDPIIQTFDLTKIFDKETLAVNKLNITVKPGIYGFLGPNGAGKTTTIKMLIGALFPTDGRIEIFGKDALGKDIADIHKRIGYVPENPTYFLDMTGWELLEYVGSIFKLPKKELMSRISNLLRLVDLQDAKSRKIAKYSAGMKQRIGIAQALINDPDLLILDEITSNLDPLGRSKMVNLLKGLKSEGKTIFISTHILPEIEKMEADSIGIIHKGQLILEGSIKELNEKLGTKIIRISPKHDLIREELNQLALNIQETANELIIESDNPDQVWKIVNKTSLENDIILNKYILSGLEIEQLFMKAFDTPKKESEAKN